METGNAEKLSAWGQRRQLTFDLARKSRVILNFSQDPQDVGLHMHIHPACSGQHILPLHSPRALVGNGAATETCSYHRERVRMV
jgi:hypothetical protein